jgi:hypothetical protein
MKKTVLIEFKTDGLTKTITSLQEASDELKRLEQRYEDLKAELEAGGVDDTATQALRASLKETETAIKTLKKELGNNNTAQNIAFIAQSFEEVTTAVQDTTGAVIDLDKELNGIQGNDNISAFGRTINDIEEEIKQLEETAKGLKIGSDEFNKVNTRVEQLKKQLQAVALEGEAVGLGFKGIGKAGNTIEGLEVKIQQLTAAYSLAQDEFEKATIAKQIEDIKTEVQLLEAVAKEGIFPEGSLGRLTAEAEKLEIQLRRMPVGTQEYGVIKKRLDEVNLQIGFLSSSVEDQKAVFRDLGQSAFQVFGNLSGVVASFAGDSKDAQEALLVLQQTLAIVDAITQASETLRLAAEAKKIAAIKTSTAVTNENTSATIANAGAQQSLSKAADGAGGSFKVLWNVIKANPLIAVVSLIAALGAAIVGLSRYFKPLGDAVNTAIDGFAGIGGAIKGLIKNFDSVKNTFQEYYKTLFQLVINPVDTLKTALKSIGLIDIGTTELEKQFEKLKESAQKTAGAITDGFKKEFDRSRAIRLLDQREALNEARRNANEIAEAQLGSARATEEARTAIRIQQLKEDSAIALQRLKLENDLTDAEIQIIKSGNIEKIKQISKIVDARGEVNEKVLEGLSKFTQSEKSILNEQDQIRQRYFQDQIALVDLRLAKQAEELKSVNSFANREKEIIANRNAELQKLELERASGALKFAEEYTLKRTQIEKAAENELNNISIERQKFLFELSKADTEFQIEQKQNLLDEIIALGQEGFIAEKEQIQRIADLRLKALDEEKKLLENDTVNAEQNRARFEEIEREKVRVAQDAQKQITDSSLREINRRIEAEQFVIDSQQTAFEIQKITLDNRIKLQERELEIIQEGIDRQQRSTFLLKDQLSLLEQRKGLILESEEQALESLTKQADEQLYLIELQRQQLELQAKENELKKETNQITDEQFQREKDRIDQQKQLLEGQDATIRVNLEIETGRTKEKTKQELEKLSDESVGIIKDRLADPLSSALSSSLDSFFSNFTDQFGNKLSGFGELVGSKFQEVVQAGIELLNTLEQARIENISRQIEDIDAQIGDAQSRIDELTEASNQSLEQIKNTQDALNQERTANFDQLTTQLNQERATRDRLQESIRAQEQEKQRFEQQKIALEKQKKEIELEGARRQKAISIISATINTALGITSALAAPFPVNVVLPITIGALGAIQIAAIASAPDPAEEGGLIMEDGKLKPARKMAGGGIVQGPSHARGGVRGTGHFAGIEVEGGEAIIPKRAVENNPVLIHKLIHEGASRKIDSTAPGTATQKHFADGGFLPSVQSLEASQNTNVARSVNNIDTGIELPPIRVAVTDIAEGLQRMNVIDTNSNI